MKLEGGDKVPMSKFGLDSSAVVFIGPIKTYLFFEFFDSVQKKTLCRSNLDLDPLYNCISNSFRENSFDDVLDVLAVSTVDETLVDARQVAFFVQLPH